MTTLFRESSVSNRGGRGQNEDYSLSVMRGDVYCRVVADGLGGHHGGELASRAACEAVVRSFQQNDAVTPDAVAEHIRRADDAVRQEQHANPALRQMKSTIALLVANATHAVYGHAGDTRLYHFRAGRVLQQTRDHSVPQTLVDAGQIPASAIRNHDDRSRLLRALGEEEPVRAAVMQAPIAIGKGDAFLLCTDGFWEHIVETEMELDLSKSADPAQWLKHMETRLQQRVNGNFDNYTAAAVLGDGLPLPVRMPVQGEMAEAIVRETRRVNTANGHSPLWLALKMAVFLVVPVLLLVSVFFLWPRPWKTFSHAHAKNPPTAADQNKATALSGKPDSTAQK